MIQKLRAISIIEAVSYLMLLTAMIFKYGFDNEAGVKILGPIHGTLYLIYAAALIINFAALGWKVPRLIAALFLGALPLGGFMVERRWLQDDEDQIATSASATSA